ncbi:MAG: CocE/NonD family hydrolase [Chloroflexota bacterium]
MIVRNRRGLLYAIVFLIIIITALVIFIFTDNSVSNIPTEYPDYLNHPSYPIKVLDVEDIQDQIIVEEDVAVVVRDGTRLSANVYRPVASGNYPVIMSFTAYGKDRGPDQYPRYLRSVPMLPEYDMGTIEVSSWTSWEGPDPAFWVPNGYVVVYVDTRGYFGSEGDASLLSEQDGEDFYDAVEWAAGMEWSNGNVGLTGVSYLAISQWVAATTNPPSLKAIMPWEGMSDGLREVLYHGGIPETAFVTFWLDRLGQGADSRPVPPPRVFRFAHKRIQLLQQLQPPAAIQLDQIKMPALIAATWSDHGMHTRGSFEGYKQIASEQKWVFTHGRAKWETYYSDEALALQKQFFDHFLKNADNGMDAVPPVRLEIREDLDTYQVRYEDDWPIPRTEYRELYLDGGTQTLQETLPATAATTTYNSESGRAAFNITFDEDTELSGNMKLKLWVSTSAGSDLDLFVGVKKLDNTGEEVFFHGKAGFNRAPVSMGWLRVSERELDVVKSTEWQPILTHANSQKISRDEIVPVEIEILPSSTLFRAGESLQVVIQGTDVTDHFSLAHTYSINVGDHSIYTGADYDSHLLVPVIP